MIDEYKNLGYKKGTFKVELELPDEFKRDFTEVGMFENKNLMAECFDRILSAIRCKDVSCIATYEREICEVLKIAMGNAKIEREEGKQNLRAEITKLQTYKMFPYEATVYVERDEVLRIFDKYTVGGEGNADSD